MSEERFPDPPSDEDIAERLRKVREELAAMELPDLPDDEVESRRQRLADSVGGTELPDVPEWNPPQPKYRQEFKPGQDRGVGVGLQIAYIIIGMPLMGLGIGWLIDRFLHTGYAMAGGVLIGMTLALFLAVRIMLEQEKK